MDYEAPAVLIVAFNRPETTRRIFQAVRQARPKRVFFACDAPRPGRQEEARRVALVRELVREVDWPCEVVTRFSEVNLGCGEAVSSAITWFLDEAGEGVILEDDCLPSPAFFSFTSAMLDRYREDERIGVISGTNLAPEVRLTSDHAFSTLYSCWGWATWRRTWRRFRLSPPPVGRQEAWAKEIGNRPFKIIRRSLERNAKGAAHTWAYPFLVQQLRDNQLSVIPRHNLVLNIGFDGDGAHFAAGKAPWWVPRFSYNFNGCWTEEVPIKASPEYDLNNLVSAHGGRGPLMRLWVKFLRRWANHRQLTRGDFWDRL
jgi:hypothetical protein